MPFIAGRNTCTRQCAHFDCMRKTANMQAITSYITSVLVWSIEHLLLYYIDYEECHSSTSYTCMCLLILSTCTARVVVVGLYVRVALCTCLFVCSHSIAKALLMQFYTNNNHNNRPFSLFNSCIIKRLKLMA